MTDDIGDEHTPNTTDQNPFTLIAYLLFRVRQSLEEARPEGAPRWVRIVRARDGTTPISTAVKSAMNGFSTVLEQMAEIVLDLREVLREVDSAKAVIELTADFVGAASSDDFINGIYALLGRTAPATNPLATVNQVATVAQQAMGVVPEPEDLQRLGYELYQLLNITQLDLPTQLVDGEVIIDESDENLKQKAHIDVNRTGRMRLIQWGFEQEMTAKGIPKPTEPPSERSSGEETTMELLPYGSRRIWQTASSDLAPESVAVVTTNDVEDQVFAFKYTGNDAVGDSPHLDIEELHKLLEEMGYKNATLNTVTNDKTVFNAEVTKMLQAFQLINNLPTTGFFDNETVSRIINMDFKAKNLRRAKPYDGRELSPLPVTGYLKLVNPDADAPQDEGIDMLNREGYDYYVAGMLPAGSDSKKGWVSDPSGVQGFVAMQSRPRDPTNQDALVGGRFSEGQASSGQMFWCARFTEPWKPGRTGQPGADALWQNQPAKHATSRMYQWVDLSGLKNNAPAGKKLYLYLSCQQRCLWIDRGQEGFPDQGRIALKAYKNIIFSGDNQRITITNTMVETASSITEYYPRLQQQIDNALSLEEIDRKRLWTLREAPAVVIDWSEDDGINAVCVILEGKHQSAWDTDAYFDDVQLRYEFKD